MAESGGGQEKNKYLRMRYLNNLASQRCRANRKKRVETIFTQLADEEERNGDLIARATSLQARVVRMKKALIKLGLYQGNFE